MIGAPAARVPLAAVGLAFALVACPGPQSTRPPAPPPVQEQPTGPGPADPAPTSPGPADPAPTSPGPAPLPPFTTVAWTSAPPAGLKRSEGQSGVVGGKLYVFGGFEGCGPTRSSEVFDPAAGTWAPLPDLPTRLSHAGTAVVGDSIYLAGGYVATTCDFNGQQFGTTDVWRYDLTSRAYQRVEPLPEARGSGALVYANGKLHFFGGVNTGRADVGDHWVLDLANESAGWVRAAPLPNPRSHMGYAALNGKVYAVGGQKDTDAKLVTQPTVEVYDPATDSWTALAPMPLARSHISSTTLVVEGRIIVLGGEKKNTVGVSDVSVYDPATNSWSALDALQDTRYSGVAAWAGGVLYYATGNPSAGGFTSAAFKGVPSR